MQHIARGRRGCTLPRHQQQNMQNRAKQAAAQGEEKLYQWEELPEAWPQAWPELGRPVDGGAAADLAGAEEDV